MKRIIILVSAVLLSSMAASAQFVNNSAGRTSSSASSEIEAVFSTFDLTYSPVKLVASYDGSSESESLNAISLNWAQARAVTSAYPIYLQYGAGLQYMWHFESKDYQGVKYNHSVHFLTVKIPVNVMYCYRLPSVDITLMPYIGLNVQGHILGQSKSKVDADEEMFNTSETVNYFSNSDMEDPYNRFVVGWQIGAKVAFKKYFAGIAYEGPVTNLYKNGDYKINTNQVNISLGIKF